MYIYGYITFWLCSELGLKKMARKKWVDYQIGSYAIVCSQISSNFFNILN
jgi:hypothetical protein